MCVFIFLIRLSEISHSNKNSARCDRKCTFVSCKLPVNHFRCEWNLNFIHRFFLKYSDTKFNVNPSSGWRIVPRGRGGEDGRTGRHDRNILRFSQLLRTLLKFFFRPVTCTYVFDMVLRIMSDYFSKGCFTTFGHHCRRWFSKSLWSKNFI